MGMAGFPHPSPVFQMEGELGGAVMAGGGMWRTETGGGSDRPARRHGDTRAERSRRDPKYHTRVTLPIRNRSHGPKKKK
jgi:hypothetical protein